MSLSALKSFFCLTTFKTISHSYWISNIKANIIISIESLLKSDIDKSRTKEEKCWRWSGTGYVIERFNRAAIYCHVKCSVGPKQFYGDIPLPAKPRVHDDINNTRSQFIKLNNELRNDWFHFNTRDIIEQCLGSRRHWMIEELFNLAVCLLPVYGKTSSKLWSILNTSI